MMLSASRSGAFFRRLGRFAGGNADRKFIAAVGAMTVSLRQTKKFLTGHKLVVALRARDIFKISHASLLLSPRFDRDLFPSLLADNFQRIDARQHFVRDRQPFGERFA